MLVVVGVLATLIALAMPSLSRARRQSMALKSAANAQSLSRVVTSYADQNKELFPSVQENVWYRVEESSSIMFPYWQVDETWIAVVSDILPRWQNLDVVYSPSSLTRRESGNALLTSYRYSWSMVAKPDYWIRDRAFDGGLISACRVFEVRFPSSKAVLWDDEAWWLGGSRNRLAFDLKNRVPVAMTDGSVQQASPLMATEPVPNPIFAEPSAMRLRNTANGCAGIDYAR